MLARLKQQASHYWQTQFLQRAVLTGEQGFPLKFPVKPLTQKQLQTEFLVMRNALIELQQSAKEKGYCIVFSEKRFRHYGLQKLPQEVVFETIDSFLLFIGKKQIFSQLKKTLLAMREAFPELSYWLESNTKKMIKYVGYHQQLINICHFFKENPSPEIYLRQLDIPGVDTKFIEQHKAILSELLDELLVAAPNQQHYSPVVSLAQNGFEKRYGLLYDEPLIRFRLLDKQLEFLDYPARDFSVPVSQFKQYPLPCQTVFITENKINGLCFPDSKNSLVIFGLGYGIKVLSEVEWLKTKDIIYWGDIDTHGFAILSQCRSYFIQTKSLLMDKATLMQHQNLWGQEPLKKRCLFALLENLTPEEQAVYQLLCSDKLGVAVRLEQERIGFNYFLEALESTVHLS